MKTSCKNADLIGPNLIDSSSDIVSDLERSRRVAVNHINLIYDALTILFKADHSKLSATTVHIGGQSVREASTTSWRRIDEAVRDSLTEALDEVSWIAVERGNTTGELLNIQAKLLLQLLDESDRTPAGALVHSIATAMAA